LIALDFASHYMHMYASLVVGGTDSSHKNIDESQNWLLRLYYTNKVSFSFCYPVNPPTSTNTFLRLSFSSPVL
jgi:CDP-diacylglycerol--inositol 3-phosphatidyltransferase